MADPATVRAAAAAAQSPAARRLVLGLLILLLVIVLVPVLAVLAVVAGTGSEPSDAALADIPAAYLAEYRLSADQYRLDWAVVAAVGKIECDHGRNRDAGCRPYTANAAGAVGPMQFLPPTWAAGRAIGETRVDVAPAPDGMGYASDGNGDGRADIWEPADAVRGAARMLAANGAPGDYRRAIFAYNHADWYVDEVLRIAAEYRSATMAGGGIPEVLAVAQRYLGTAYVWGGNHGRTLDGMRSGTPVLMPGRDGRLGFFDCSSLVAWAFAKGANRYVGDVTWEQWRFGAAIPGALRGYGRPSDGFRPGDLVFFHDLEHVGLALDGRRFIHAPSTGRDVMISDLASYPGLYGWVRYPATGDDAP